MANGHLKVWRLTNFENIALMSEYLLPRATIHNVLIEEQLAYVSYYSAGTRVVDLVDPVNPLEVGAYDTSDGPGGFEGNWGVYPFRGDNVIYSSDTREGLFILEFTGNYAGRITATVRNAETQALIKGAMIAVNERLTLETNNRGTAAGRTVAAEYDVVTTAFGHFADTTRVTIPPSATVQHRVALESLPTGDVEIVLLEASGHEPLADVMVDVLVGAFPDVTTGPDGHARIRDLPGGVSVPLRCVRFGLVTTDVEVISRAGETVTVAVPVARGARDDFEYVQGWSVGAPDDDATDGLWERAHPLGSYLFGIVAPDGDASLNGDGFAFITKLHHPHHHASASDVDDGKTTLISPVFDLAGLENVRLSYDRWFSNRAPQPDDDEFRVDVSADGGDSWANVETLTVGTDAWVHVDLDLSSQIAMTSEMQLRFVAEDGAPATVVEAAVDNVSIHARPDRFPSSGFAPDSPPPGLSFESSLGGEGVGLARPRPNPFATRAIVEFEVETPGPVTLTVHDVTGRRVVSLLEARRFPRGRHQVAWDGRAVDGLRAAPGVYFVRLRAADRTWERKVVRTR
jgi:hypothetical protein